MKNVYEVLRQKEMELTRLEKEVEALRLVAPLLSEEKEMNAEMVKIGYCHGGERATGAAAHPIAAGGGGCAAPCGRRAGMRLPNAGRRASSGLLSRRPCIDGICVPQGLKPRSVIGARTARLKACPFRPLHLLNSQLIHASRDSPSSSSRRERGVFWSMILFDLLGCNISFSAASNRSTSSAVL